MPHLHSCCTTVLAVVAQQAALGDGCEQGGWVGGVTTRPTAAEHMYSVASKEEIRKEKSRGKGKERAGAMASVVTLKVNP